MESVGKKHFCCPKCGAGYMVVFDGKRYRCKKCQEAFTVPDDNLPEPIAKEKVSRKKAFQTGCLVLLAFFLILSFFVYERPDNKDNKSKEAEQSEPPKPSVTNEMYQKRFELFTNKINVPEIRDLITGCSTENWNIKIIVSDIWFSMPTYQQERMINLLQSGLLQCSAEAGIPETSSGRIYIYDQYGEQLGHWSAWSGAKLEK